MIDPKNQIRITAATQDILKGLGLPLHGQEAVTLERTISSFYIRGYVDRGKDIVRKNRKKKNKKAITYFTKEAIIDQGIKGE